MIAHILLCNPYYEWALIKGNINKETAGNKEKFKKRLAKNNFFEK